MKGPPAAEQQGLAGATWLVEFTRTVGASLPPVVDDVLDDLWRGELVGAPAMDEIESRLIDEGAPGFDALAAIGNSALAALHDVASGGTSSPVHSLEEVIDHLAQPEGAGSYRDVTRLVRDIERAIARASGTRSAVELSARSWGQAFQWLPTGTVAGAVRDAWFRADVGEPTPVVRVLGTVVEVMGLSESLNSAGWVSRFLDGAQMRTSDALLAQLAAAFQLRPSAATNWNAASDCMEDLSQVTRQTVGVALFFLDADQVLADDPEKGLACSNLRQLLRGLRDNCAMPVELGEWWDRPAIEFLAAVHGDDLDEWLGQPVTEVVDAADLRSDSR